MSTPKLDAFTRAYLLAALWTEDPAPGQGDYQEHDDWTIENIDPDWLARAIDDCARFQNSFDATIADRESEAGHDFWLTRNGHGAGFWDGDWPEPAATHLTNAAETLGEIQLQMIEVDAEPIEPAEDDITTSDHRQFYQSGRRVLFRLAQTWRYWDSDARGERPLGTFGDDHAAALRAYMERTQFWPNCWFISDHGNAHLMDLSEKGGK